jgi:hypothetical protein
VACKAMSNYRLGHFPEAIDWAEKAAKGYFQIHAGIRQQKVSLSHPLNHVRILSVGE